MSKKQKRHTPVAEKLDAPEGGLDVIEEGGVAKKRMRRGDHLQRVLELVGMKKKEELCHHIPQKQCVIVSSFEIVFLRFTSSKLYGYEEQSVFCD